MNIETTPNPKCNVCKCYWTPTDADILPSGLVSKSCTKCKNRQKEIRENNKCEHAKRKPRCIHCGGSSICEHNRFKSNCKECGGSSICEHNKIKSQCRECGGSKYCTHNRFKSNCKECNFKLYLINLQRGQIKRCLKNSNLKKTKPSIEYLGCSAEYFIEYFKKKMNKFNLFSEIEMTWDNIHIDHIKPVSVFDLDNEDEFLNCCNYTNLQPLIAEINLSKHNKWNDISNDFWLNNIIDKEYLDIYIP